jgi:hypothetical protein
MHSFRHPTIQINQEISKILLSFAKVWDNSSSESQFKHEQAPCRRAGLLFIEEAFFYARKPGLIKDIV